MLSEQTGEVVDNNNIRLCFTDKDRGIESVVENKGSARTSNSNATPSAFGWEFQFNAAILVMLNVICEAKEIKVEGDTEDIEVFLTDGTVVFAQAKGCMTPEDATNALRDLKKALGTLSVASQTGMAQSLIFVTNRSNPFNKQSTIQRFSMGYSCVPYSDLPNVCKKCIGEIVDKENLTLETEKLSVMVFDFAGEEPNRYRMVKQRIAEFLVSLGDTCSGWSQKTMERWQLSFGKNASNKSKRITKQEMIWPLIVWMSASGTHDWLQDYDEATYNQIIFGFKKMINETSERFEFVTKVMADYAVFQKQHQGMKQNEVTKKFIVEKSMMFGDEFDLSGLEEDVARAIIKLTVEKILRDRFIISKMKKVVNL